MHCVTSSNIDQQYLIEALHACMRGLKPVEPPFPSQVVRALNPGAVTSLGEQYTHAFNTLLRRELHLYTAVLRRQIAAGNHISPPDVILAKSSKKVSCSKPPVSASMALT